CLIHFILITNGDHLVLDIYFPEFLHGTLLNYHYACKLSHIAVMGNFCRFLAFLGKLLLRPNLFRFEQHHPTYSQCHWQRYEHYVYNFYILVPFASPYCTAKTTTDIGGRLTESDCPSIFTSEKSTGFTLLGCSNVL